MAGKHAIIFGASGITGWAVVDQLLRGYPTKGTFTRVTALINRPFPLSKSGWVLDTDIPEIQLVSGVDLVAGSAEESIRSLKERIESLESVTHAFYFAYKQAEDPHMEIEMNCEMLKSALSALEQYSPNLQFIVFPSGANAYGVSCGGGFLSPPFIESMPRLSHPVCDMTHYYKFEDILTEHSQGKKWTWCEVRPDIVVSVCRYMENKENVMKTMMQIGVVPNSSAVNLAAYWAVYLIAYAAVEGTGAEIAFPGTEGGWKALYNGSSAEIVAKVSIWASLNRDKTSGQCYNIADQAEPSTMKELWPVLADHFGLKGVGPTGDMDSMKPREYIQQHSDVLEKLGIQADQAWGMWQMDGIGYYLTFDRQLSLEKVRAAGFQEERDTKNSWIKAVEKMKDMGLLGQ
ncbi:hypothetical protein VNI00_005406 [Paramarasmius palmivorus]|uniref:PRISE-like Rossmann-fold domain-containing protein n=1 Tax=Paramarasmius palmivorus TaxID=297713 RepID=A0AAW0DFA0_9AGAR